MYRWLIFMTMVFLAVPTVAAADEFVLNGDWESSDDNWTQWDYGYNGAWKPSWNVTNTGPTRPEGTVAIIGGSGSQGWYQACKVPVGEYVQLNVDWAGNLPFSGWAQIFLFAIPNMTAL